MNYVIQAVLSNTQHPECGQVTIPFPIPVDQYDKTIEMLQAIDLGFSVNRDCKVDEIDSRYFVLDSIKGTLVNIDQLDYLAKRLDGFCSGEVSQFQAMAHKLGLNDITDFINLTYCCQRTTVITDFSDLEQIGKNHAITMNGGAMPMNQYQAVDGRKDALQLIQGGGETVTPFGVVYDNGMKLVQVYSGLSFPQYLYNAPLLTLGVPSEQAAETAWLYLPASRQQIDRTLRRAGITNDDAAYFVEDDTLPSEVSRMLGCPDDPIPALNRMCCAISALNADEVKKLEAVVLMAQPQDAEGICQLAENLGQFDFVPLPDGQTREHEITELGYVAYHGTLALDELMREDPAEQYQREQGMGGLA